MNRSGIFITFMVFLIAMGIVSLYNETKNLETARERQMTDKAAFNAANESFNNLFEEVVGLNKEDFAKEVQQRAMPFSYDLNKGSIKLTQRLPQRESVLRSYFDALNIYSVFADNFQNEGGTAVSTTPPLDARWGGTEDFPLFTYALLPQCLLYDMNNGNTMLLRAGSSGSNKCTQNFSYSDVKIFDIGIGVNTQSYLPGAARVTCNGAFDAGGCANQPFDPASDFPYGIVTISEQNSQCPGIGCLLTDASGIKRIANHFDPEEAVIDSVVLQATDTNGVRIKFGKESADDSRPITIRNGFVSAPLQADLNVAFKQKISLFYFTGFGISVSKEKFSIVRET